MFSLRLKNFFGLGEKDLTYKDLKKIFSKKVDGNDFTKKATWRSLPSKTMVRQSTFIQPLLELGVTATGKKLWDIIVFKNTKFLLVI